jgi:hypothetical protein
VIGMPLRCELFVAAVLYLVVACRICGFSTRGNSPRTIYYGTGSKAYEVPVRTTSTVHTVQNARAQISP